MDSTLFCNDSTYTTFQIKSNQHKTKNNDHIIVHISGAPTISSIDNFSRLMKDNGVTDVFCFCKLSYDPKTLEKNQINFHHLEFEDGRAPDCMTTKKFDTLIDKIIENAKCNNQLANINMHCHAGMGRAPTILAYLMITKFHWDNIESIDHIRKFRRGSFNRVQLNWVADFKPPSTKIKCVIM